MLVPLLAVLALLIAGIFLLRSSQRSQQLESYKGTITQILPDGWQVDDTRIVIDAQTTIHGDPVVGAKIICVGRDLPRG